MELNWSEETFSVPHLIENIEFPQLLKLANDLISVPNSNIIKAGSTSEIPQLKHTSRSKSLAREGDILKLHGVRTFKKIIATGAGSSTSCEQVAHEYGYLSPPGSTSIYRQFKLPINFSTPMQILPFRDQRHVYPTAGDLVKERPRPTAVVVNKAISIPEKHCFIQEGDVLAITSVDKRCTNAGVVDFLICKHNDKTIGLPMSCVGNFTVLIDETLFTLNDLVSKHIDIGLPQKVVFHAVTKDSTQPDHATKTLQRGGEHHVIPGEEYVIENIIKEQYLVCTKCDEKESLGNNKVYFIPTNSATARQMKVRLPLFHDLKSYKQTLNGRYCPNLSMREIIDGTPIEVVDEPAVTMRKLSEVYDFSGPLLPPRKELYPPSETASMRSAVSSPYICDAAEGSNYANVKVIHSRMNSSESNLLSENDSRSLMSQHGSVSHGRQRSNLSDNTMSVTAEEQPLLGGGSNRSSPRSTRRSAGGERLAMTNNNNKTPVLQRKGTSTPCTPESRRRNKHESPTWTEKISISLENLKRTFRKAGSEERVRTKIGDGSQLADSFEDLSICNPAELGDASTPPSSDYENMRAMVTQIGGKPVGRTRPILQNIPVISGIPPSKCSQIKELWTPPCSPDWRDYTTNTLDQSSNKRSFPQFNNSNSNYIPIFPTGDNIQQSVTEPSQLQQPLSVQQPLCVHQQFAAQQPFSSPSAFSYPQIDPPKPRSKSPKAAPRHVRDFYSSQPAVGASNGLYENIGNMSPFINRCPPPVTGEECAVTPPSRCSGYSSGSRGSSETDLLHYQLEMIKTVDMIPSDLTTLSVPGLCDCLHLFELPNVAHKFKQHQIDGQFFMIMSDQMFRDDAFSFSEFELLKLKRLRDGWRPRL